MDRDNAINEMAAILAANPSALDFLDGAKAMRDASSGKEAGK